MDLFGPTKTQSLGGKRYGLVIVDDFSRYTWVLFLTHKDETFNVFEKFCKRIQNEKGMCISSIKVIMVENSKIKFLKPFVKKMELAIIFHVVELLNKMG